VSFGVSVYPIYFQESHRKGFGGKPEGTRRLGRPRRKWEDGVRMDLWDISLGGGGGLDSTGSGQGPVAGCCECGYVPSGSCATELVSWTN
jgi:hypothetical protein